MRCSFDLHSTKSRVSLILCFNLQDPEEEDEEHEEEEQEEDEEEEQEAAQVKDSDRDTMQVGLGQIKIRPCAGSRTWWALLFQRACMCDLSGIPGI